MTEREDTLRAMFNTDTPELDPPRRCEEHAKGCIVVQRIKSEVVDVHIPPAQPIDLSLLPEPGTDAEYDKALASARHSIEALDVPYDDDEVRWSIGKLVAKKRGVRIEDAWR